MDNISDKISSVARLETELELAENCEHTQTELRVKTSTSGSKMYGYQCLRCGRTVLTNNKLWQSVKDIHDIESLNPYDENLSETYNQVKSALRQQLAETKWNSTYQYFQENYPKYLQSETWKKKRQLVLMRANYICEGCGNQRATIVHHTTYKNKGNEFLFELVAVCKDCHERLHPEHNENG